MDEFACGSRSTSSVFFLRMASAAARLIAVVVFPTPPFWFAMAMTIMVDLWKHILGKPPAAVKRNPRGLGVVGPRGLHLVFAELFVGQALEPLLEAAEVHGLLAGLDATGVLDDRLLDEDRGLRAQRQGDRIGRTGIHGQGLVTHGDVDGVVEGVLLQRADDD